ncbi:monovalent cation/H+ antiporter complex subunit F [Falsiroseomonas sp.]|uniref:monovalent cation/H+ antiporter complex subunit F n=1 Tax=Falsiroseomonas sp. TaxID=2870721 RepID=UPI00271A27F7|nr:monovalent cation/H+ antiporter complex subunit F [Falsiroseomonas sp.]MDO9500128.1 monovalent cation/H+ antiporter complex subunit F [Falsiroseomonas sp.]
MTSGLIYWAAALAVAIVALGIAPVAWRLLAGPSSADRAIATDMLGLIGACLAALAAVIAGDAAFLTIALGIALVGFLAAVAFARLLERSGTKPGDEPARERPPVERPVE